MKIHTKKKERSNPRPFDSSYQPNKRDMEQEIDKTAEQKVFDEALAEPLARNLTGSPKTPSQTDPNRKTEHNHCPGNGFFAPPGPS